MAKWKCHFCILSGRDERNCSGSTFSEFHPSHSGGLNLSGKFDRIKPRWTKFSQSFSFRNCFSRNKHTSPSCSIVFESLLDLLLFSFIFKLNIDVDFFTFYCHFTIKQNLTNVTKLSNVRFFSGSFSNCTFVIINNIESNKIRIMLL